MPKHTQPQHPASPILRNICDVARGPSRHSMKPSRKVEANTARQNTTVQLSSTGMKRAIVPPKLHVTAAPATSSTPCRKSAVEGSGIACEVVMGPRR